MYVKSTIIGGLLTDYNVVQSSKNIGILQRQSSIESFSNSASRISSQFRSGVNSKSKLQFVTNEILHPVYPRIEILYLSGNNFNHSAATILANSLSFNSSLKVLHLGSGSVGEIQESVSIHILIYINLFFFFSLL